MNAASQHYILSDLNHPKRYLGLTIDESVIAGIGTVFLILSNQKIIGILSCLAFLYGLKKLKKNRGPRFLIVLAYWYLPHALTRFVLPKLPDSAIKFLRT